jgi:hypothetical protein
MATISNPTLTIVGVNNTTVKATVAYNLAPSAVEKLAGSVFSETVQVIGDDAGILTDIVISTLPSQAFAVNGTTSNVARSRSVNLLKSALNEDSGFTSTGAELVDEIVGRITLTYAANPPIPPALPGPTTTNTIAGAWK